MAKKEKEIKEAKPILTKEEKKAIKIMHKNEKAVSFFEKKQKKTTPIHVGIKKEIVPVKMSPDGEPIKNKKFGRKNTDKNKSKVNWRLAFREFPVKMAKEVGRIRWASKGSLGRKFLITILFIIVFAVFYLVLDIALDQLLDVAKII